MVCVTVSEIEGNEVYSEIFLLKWKWEEAVLEMLISEICIGWCDGRSVKPYQCEVWVGWVDGNVCETISEM